MSSTPRLAMRATALDISDAEARAGAERLVSRLSGEDASLWSDEAGQQAEIANLLGWIRIAERIEPEAEAIWEWASETSAGIDDVVLLGMGGSSLAPEVMAAMLPAGRVEARRIKTRSAAWNAPSVTMRGPINRMISRTP